MTTAAPMRPEVMAALRVMARKQGESKFVKYRDDPVGFIRDVLREWP